MGRGKIEIKKIENINSRQVTFSKRRGGLFKKANELAVLCEADVAVIIFSNTGKLFEFSSTNMKKILARYKKCLDPTPVPAIEPKEEKQEAKEANLLKEEIEKLKSNQQRLLGKDLTGMGLKELNELEQQLQEGLLCIKERKEQMLLQQLAQSRMEEQRILLDNETLRGQVEELRSYFQLTGYPAPLSIDYHLSGTQGSPATKEGSGSAACDDGLVDEVSDTTLHLGLPSEVRPKRKTRDAETHSGTPEARVRVP